MASVRKRSRKSNNGTITEHWEVIWKELEVRIDVDGTEVKTWKSRRKRVPSKKAGDELARKIETAASTGENWTEQRRMAKATVAVSVIGYLKASKSKSKSTQRHRASLLQKWMDWAGEDRTLDTLTPGLLRAYADSLTVKSTSRYLGTVEQWWDWTYRNREDYPGVPEPRKLTGSDGEIQHKPAPVSVDTPTWLDVDLMIHALTEAGAPQGEGSGYGYRPQWELHRRIAVVQRYTGLRISQIISLTWDDLDLNKGWLIIRAQRRGAKGQSRDRVVPLHPELGKILAGWGRREGLLFTRTATKGERRGEEIAPRGSEVAEVMANAWERAGVEESKWGAAGDRAHGRPTNAVRARWKSTIAGAVSYELATLMLGQSTRGDHDAYVAMGNPEASPYWDKMVEALKAIPAQDQSPVRKIVNF